MAPTRDFGFCIPTFFKSVMNGISPAFDFSPFSYFSLIPFTRPCSIDAFPGVDSRLSRREGFDDDARGGSEKASTSSITSTSTSCAVDSFVEVELRLIDQEDCFVVEGIFDDDARGGSENSSTSSISSTSSTLEEVRAEIGWETGCSPGGGEAKEELRRVCRDEPGPLNAYFACKRLVLSPSFAMPRSCEGAEDFEGGGERVRKGCRLSGSLTPNSVAKVGALGRDFGPRSDGGGEG